MTIEQTIEVPENRRVILDVPEEVPTGKVRLLIQFPIQEDTQTDNIVPVEVKGQIRNEAFRRALTVEEALQTAAEKVTDPNRKPITRHFGTISKHTFGDPVAYQRAIRDEWD